MTDELYVEERLRAYIQPREPVTPAQLAAFQLAVEAQTEYETTMGMIPAGAQSISNDGVSITFAGVSSSGDGYSSDTISPAAKAILINAGLIVRSWPTARKP